MANHRMQRTTEDIRRELTDILRTLKDPRIQGLISIVRVDVTNDLSYANIYISSMEGLESAKHALEGLKSAAGYARKELGARLKLRHVPQLLFHATDSIEYSSQINKKLLDLGISSKKEEEEQDGFDD